MHVLKGVSSKSSFLPELKKNNVWWCEISLAFLVADGAWREKFFSWRFTLSRLIARDASTPLSSCKAKQITQLYGSASDELRKGFQPDTGNCFANITPNRATVIHCAVHLRSVTVQISTSRLRWPVTIQTKHQQFLSCFSCVIHGRILGSDRLFPDNAFSARNCASVDSSCGTGCTLECIFEVDQGIASPAVLPRMRKY